MKRPHLTHGIWLLVTIGTFVTGSQVARRSVSAGGSESPASAGERGEARRVVESNPADWPPAAPRRMSGETAPPPRNSSKSSRSPAPVRGASAKTAASGSSAPPGGSPAARPLGRKQIQSLVRQAIKSANPVERRAAFDRLLEEMRSESFTREQAMTIRIAMARDGANGELWRLFDYAWGANDPAVALAHLDEIPEQYFNGFLSNMIPGLASVDPQGAIDLFEGLQPDLQAKIRKRLFEGLIDNDVEVATDYIYDATDLENFYWRPMDELTREIVKEQGLEATLEWANGLPEGPLRGSAWSAAYAHWGAHDPQVAVEAIIEMPPSQDRNQAINGFISALAHQDGQRAVEWAGEITQPGMREAAQLRVAKQYYQQDPEEATRWFDGSGLPETAWEQMTGQPRRAPVESEQQVAPQIEVQVDNS